MPWPYAFFAFVIASLCLTGHLVAGAMAAVAATGFLALELRRTPRKFLWFIALGAVLGMTLAFVRSSSESRSMPITSGEALVTGVSKKSVVVLVNGSKLRLTGFKKDSLPQKYSRVRYTCEVQTPPESTFMAFERLSGVVGWCRSQTISTLEEPRGLLHELRQKTLTLLRTCFNLMGEHSLIAAFLLGDTDEVSPRELAAFRDMGLMHLFAVSGLNIALLFALIYLPFRFFGIGALGSALGFIVASAFLLLLDFPVPLLRAWLFMAIGLLMRLIDRRIPPWTLLFLTACITELLFPLSTFSMSFILSFGVTAAILIFYEPIRFCFGERNRFLNLVSDHVALTLAAGFPALILSFLLFQSASPFSLIYNLLLVPFSGLYLFAALVFLLFEPVRFVLHGLDLFYLRFADWHINFVTNLLPAPDDRTQAIVLGALALALLALWYLAYWHRLWSVRRHLRFIVPVVLVLLALPYFFARSPTSALYAVANKVWLYDAGTLRSSGQALFEDVEPQTCFPVRSRETIKASLAMDFHSIGGRCIIFAGRMRPETWSAALFKTCSSVELYQSKSISTTPTQWREMFALFGYQGPVNLRKYFTWYADTSAPCVKEKL